MLAEQSEPKLEPLEALVEQPLCSATPIAGALSYSMRFVDAASAALLVEQVQSL